MRTLFIDSRDRTSSSAGPTDFSVELKSTLTLTDGHRLRVSDLRIPQCVPTIRAGLNDTLIINDGVSSVSYTIPAGNYDGHGLASIIQTTLRTGSGFLWVVVHDETQMTMTISRTGGVDFQIVGGTYAKQLMQNPYTKSGPSYTFQFVSVLGTDVFYLCSPQFANLDNFGPNNCHDVLLAVNVISPYASVLEHSMSYETWLDCPALTTQLLSFQIRDRYGNILALPSISFLLTID